MKDMQKKLGSPKLKNFPEKIKECKSNSYK